MTNTMNMLPNDHHPGPRCSCAECLRKYPDERPANHSADVSAPEPRVEPVAYLYESKRGWDLVRKPFSEEELKLATHVSPDMTTTPLYAHPAPPSPEAPVAWLHTLHMEGGQTTQRLTCSPTGAFGAPGKDHSPEPLYRASQPPTAAPDIAAIRAVIAEMIQVAANGDRDEADWTADNCAQIDAWQVRLAEAVAGQLIKCVECGEAGAHDEMCPRDPSPL